MDVEINANLAELPMGIGMETSWTCSAPGRNCFAYRKNVLFINLVMRPGVG